MGNVELVIVVCVAVLVLDLLALALLSGARRGDLAVSAADAAREREAAKYDVLRARGVNVCPPLTPAELVEVRRFFPDTDNRADTD